MKKFRFREFPVYQKSREFRKEVKIFVKVKFPQEERFSLTLQLYRALNSIILNIAEGADRGTDKDFAHFLNLSHTSLNEVVACLDCALDDEYISREEHQSYLEKAEDIGNQLTAFRKKLLNP